MAPVLLLMFVAIISTLPLRWTRRDGVPKWGALALITFVLRDLGSLMALITTGALVGFRDSLPTYPERFLVLSEQFGHWAESLGIGGSTEAVPDLINPNKVSAAVCMLLSKTSSLLATGLLVWLISVFMLLEGPNLSAKLSAAFGMTARGDARLRRVLAAMNHCMRIKCLMSLLSAICAWLLMWLTGIDFAPLGAGLGS